MCGEITIRPMVLSMCSRGRSGRNSSFMSLTNISDGLPGPSRGLRRAWKIQGVGPAVVFPGPHC